LSISMKVWADEGADDPTAREVVDAESFWGSLIPSSVCW